MQFLIAINQCHLIIFSIRPYSILPEYQAGKDSTPSQFDYAEILLKRPKWLGIILTNLQQERNSRVKMAQVVPQGHYLTPSQ